MKDDVREVSAGTECGLAVEGFKDWEVGPGWPARRWLGGWVVAGSGSGSLCSAALCFTLRLLCAVLPLLW